MFSLRNVCAIKNAIKKKIPASPRIVEDENSPEILSMWDEIKSSKIENIITKIKD
jgi:hypothetical protein